MKRSLLLLAVSSALSVTCFSGRASAVISPNDLPRFALHAKAVTKTSLICTTASPNADGLDCNSYTTNWSLFTGVYVYIVVAQGPQVGVAGASFGIAYNPALNLTDYINFTPCADGQVFFSDGGNGDFPAACGGIRVTWDTCQEEVMSYNGVHAVVGAIYMYAYANDVMSVTPNNNLGSGPELAVTTCDAETIQILEELSFDPGLVPLMLGRVQFGVGSGGFTPYGLTNSGNASSRGNIPVSPRPETGMDPWLYPCLPSPVLPTSWGRLKSRY